MHKVCLMTALFAVSVYANNYGGVPGSSGSGLIDVGELADQMVRTYGATSGGHAGNLAGHSGAGGFSGGLDAGLDAGPVAAAPIAYDTGAGGLAGGLAGGDLLGDAPIESGSLGGGAVGNVGLVGSGCAGGACGGPASGQLAVIRQSKVDFVPHPSNDGPVEPTNVFVDSHSSPVNLVVRSFSAGVNLDVKHIPSRGTYRQSESQDEPSKHVHTVRKPVIQIIREIITPYRFVKQEIQPVQEEILTNVPRAVAAAPVPVGPAFAPGPGGVAFIDAGAAGLGNGFSNGGLGSVALGGAGFAAFGMPKGCSGPGCLQGGFVPLKPKCSNRGGCGVARKLAGPVVPSFGPAAVGGAAY